MKSFCQFCNKEFNNSNNRKTCSSECAIQLTRKKNYESGHFNEYKRTKICEYCKQEFYDKGRAFRITCSEKCQKILAVLTRKNNGNYKHTQEQRDNLSKRFAGEGNPRYGAKLTDEHKQIISNANTGLIRTQENRKRIKDGLKKHYDEVGRGRTYEEKYGKERAIKVRKLISKIRIEKGLAKGDKNPFFGRTPKPNDKYGRIGIRKDLDNTFFRSCAEANVARFLRFLNIPYIYEPKRIRLSNTTYLPDFFIPKLNLYIEVKPYTKFLIEKKAKLDEFSKSYNLFIIDEIRYRIIGKYYKFYIQHWE